MASSKKQYKLQLALDFLELKPALKIAKVAEEYMDVMEAGTPLIKSMGLDSVRELRKLFPKKEIVADMKTTDVGYLETEIAFKAGADITTVLAGAPVETIQGALDAGKDYGKKVMIDFIGCDVLRRYLQIRSHGIPIDLLLVHTGVDQQQHGKSPLEGLRALKEKHLELAVAGGLNAATIPQAIQLGANHLIVGGAITKSKDPKESAKQIREALEAAIHGR